jgi:hypothetical protein
MSFKESFSSKPNHHSANNQPDFSPYTFQQLEQSDYYSAKQSRELLRSEVFKIDYISSQGVGSKFPFIKLITWFKTKSLVPASLAIIASAAMAANLNPPSRIESAHISRVSTMTPTIEPKSIVISPYPTVLQKLY